MMKRFFFRSSTPSNSKNNSVPPPVTDKQVYREDEGECGRRHGHASKRAQYGSQSSYFEDHNPVFVNECLETNPALRRCHSFSSGAFLASGIGQGFCDSPSDSPTSSGSSVQTQNYNHMSRREPPTPEKHNKAKRFDESSRNSTNSSSNDSNKVLDLYIDGEQNHESTGQKGKASQKDRAGKGGGKRPPRVKHSGYTTPSSPTGSLREKTNFSSVKGMQQYFSPKDWVESGSEHDFSQDLAKRVVERLAHSHLKNSDPDVPISIEDVYAGSLDGRFGLRSTEIDQKACYPSESENDGISNAITGDDVDAALRSKLREVEQKIYSFSSELEQESFLEDIEFHVPEALVHKTRGLVEEKTSFALEVSAALRNHIDERSTSRQEFSSQFRRLEREKTELLSTLEKELDRRSSDWSYKLEKFQEEERRLRQRTKELAEQNVSLQREVSSLSEKEKERSNVLLHSDEQIKELSVALETTRNENQELRHHFRELQENYKIMKEERDCVRRNYQVKEDECKDLHRSITRLLRTCSEQEKTIDGLNGVLGESVERKHQPRDSLEKHMHKLQIEQVRLVGVEQALRREVESYKHEVGSLRNENVNLLNRLKASVKDGGSLTFKLDQELSARLRCLQTQGLNLLADSTNLCSLLVDHVKGGIEVKGSNLDGQFIMDCDLKIQGLRRGAESMSRSLQTVSSVFHEKSMPGSSESQTQNQDDGGFSQLNEQLQDLTRYKLKAEMLLTNLLQEKLYARELEIEQLQAELATAVRGADVLRCKLQSALDTVSSTTHKMKDLELQILKCNEKMNRQENDLEECTKELAVAKEKLPKLKEERDRMWSEVQQYSEDNMLLNAQVNALKKRIGELEEDSLLKEGEITILKDQLGKPFDLLSSCDHTEEFKLQ